MSQNQISPPWALGQCDICGFHYKLNQLRDVVFDQRPTGSKACPDCWDLDSAQLQLGRIRVLDPQSLINPRPDLNRPGSVGLFGWSPLGNPNIFISCQVGTITVLIA